jgi:hypothetical protein
LRTDIRRTFRSPLLELARGNEGGEKENEAILFGSGLGR